RDAERLGNRARRDQHMTAGQAVVAQRQRRRPHESRPSVERRDTRFRVALLVGGRHRIRGGALGAHERRPVDRDTAGAYATLGERPRRVDGFGRRHEDLLGNASAERARAAERARVDDRDGPSGVTAARGRLGRDTATDDDEIVASVHELEGAAGPPPPRLATSWKRYRARGALRRPRRATSGRPWRRTPTGPACGTRPWPRPAWPCR